MSSSRVTPGFLTTLAIAVALAVPARPQVTASISGSVDDASGTAVPDAVVTVKNVETGSTRAVTTDTAGTFRVLSLAVGGYEVTAERPGFKTVVRSGINLVVGQEAIVNLRLEVGEVVQKVSVTGEAPLVNTTTSAVSGLVSERQVKDLPLNGRSFDNLITLNAGAVNYTSNKSGPQNGTGEGNYFSVAGRRPLENLFLLNGIEYTGSSVIGITPGGASGQLLGIDAVREFNVLTDAYSAEYGKRAGTQVTIVTQSGTNGLHGSLFEFLRNSALDARNYFDAASIAPFKRNQFGGALGGPIRKDKLFLFGNYEGFRQRLGVSDVTIVPDDNARQGLLPDSSGVLAPVPNLSRGMLPFTAFWPEPNGPNLGNGVALAFSNPKQSIREDFGTARADYAISQKDTLSGSYTVDDGENLTPLADPLFASLVILRSQVGSLQETRVFSPRVVNTARFGFSRAGFTYDSPALGQFPASLSFFQGKPPGALIVGGSTATSASAITPAGATNTPDTHNARTLFTYDDRVQIVKGNHQITAGVWFESIRSNGDTASQKTGRAVFSSLTTFLQGKFSTFSGVPNATPLGWRSLEGAWFVEDSIRLRPNLTVRLGLRHEFTNGYNEQHGRAPNFVTDSNGVLITNPRVSNSPFTENDATKLFGPRVGLAWDVFGNGKTAVRSGFGMYYTLLDDLDFHLNSMAPFNSLIAFQGPTLPAILPILPGVPQTPVCGPGVPSPCTTYAPEGVQTNMKTPAAAEWNLSVEQELARSTVLRLEYTGSHGYHNIVNEDLNTIPPQVCASSGGCVSGGIGAKGAVSQGALYIPVGSRPNPYLSNGFFWMSAGNASYNAFDVELNRRLAQGLQFRVNYTYSKNLDNGSGLSSSQSINQSQQMLDRFDPRLDWGRSAMDVRHRFSTVASYELPFGQGKHWLGGAHGLGGKLAGGWQANAIITVQSGFPLTPQVGSNRSGDGNSRNPDRPDVNPNFSGPVLLDKPNQWFNPNAFVLPIAGTYGNVGRGTLEGPGLSDVDVSFFKNTRLTERLSLQFRAEAFNILNHTNFGVPNPVVFQGASVSSSAGLVTSTATTSREIQFGAKLVF